MILKDDIIGKKFNLGEPIFLQNGFNIEIQPIGNDLQIHTHPPAVGIEVRKEGIEGRFLKNVRQHLSPVTPEKRGDSGISDPRPDFTVTIVSIDVLPAVTRKTVQ